ncbi:glycosyltransferase family 2 protein [Autumnicola edwardsiae]|uniref:Glycosyltransferase family 2 protein n=1 Tax=Autumnicola edwardsiae TaxID=3075594 RepID=A0ABU3CWS4_9FLAO|nr:glycosyltransferase family 2 protein [Zunongwangia sp. F297]MDT0650826.1 glycosyltransferase family 2 protein [Zunongwangia sp. F297]
MVSIIIPTYNRAHLIGETLESVIQQTYVNWECIVVDDGSTDYTEELLEFYCAKDPRIKYHERPVNSMKGANACRNYGFEVSKGEYINWFDSDDLMLPNFLTFMIELLTGNIDFVICSGYYTNQKLEIGNKIELFETRNLFKEYVLWNLQILTPSILFKKAFLNKKKLFNTNLKRGEETEFYSRIFFQTNSLNYKLKNIPLFLYRQHAGSKSSKDKVYVEEHSSSRSYISVVNMSRSLKLNDYELINYYYKSLVLMFFTSIENDHPENAKYILNNLLKFNRLFPSVKKVQLFVLLNICISLNRSSYRMRKYLLSRKIK